jgi:hypothetical protein
MIDALSESHPTQRSYRHLIDDDIFTNEKDKDIAEKIIGTRYETAFNNIQALLEKNNLFDFCSVNPDLLWAAHLDYFEDIARLKNFHGHKYVNTDKIYAYEVFWYLRNHVIQIEHPVGLPEQFIHVNERIFSYWLIKKLATELNYRPAKAGGLAHKCAPTESRH